MPKRKKGSKRRRSRRVGGGLGLGKKDNMIKLAGLAAGFFLGDSINEKIESMLTTTTPSTATTAATTVPPSSTMKTLITVGEVGIGGLLLMKRGAGTSGKVMTVAGGVLAGAGLKRVLKQMGVLKGYQMVPVIGKHRMAGYQATPVIGGTPPQLAGRPAQLQGFRVNGYTPTGSGVMGKIGGVDTGSGITSDNGSGYMG